MLDLRLVLPDQNLDPASGMRSWLHVFVCRRERDVLHYPAVVGDVGEDGFDRGVAVLRGNVLGGGAHLDEALQENLDPGIDGVAECLCKLLYQLAAIGGHCGSQRVGDLEDTV